MRSWGPVGAVALLLLQCHASPMPGGKLLAEVEKRQFSTFGPDALIIEAHSEILQLRTTFVPGYPPQGSDGDLYLWPGLHSGNDSDQGDLIQVL